MTILFVSLVRKLIFFTCSIGLGVAGFLFAQHWDTSSKSSNNSVNSTADLPRTAMAFDAEPLLLTRAESPVDLGGDAFGVTYILEKGGDILRVTPAMGGESEVTQYTSLAGPKVDESIGFSAIAFHPQFLARGLPGFGKFYVVVAEKANSGEADFAPEFGNTGEHHQDVLYELATHSPLSTEFDGRMREVMRFSQPGPENNLRSLVFDLNGALYLGVGDGASEGVSRNSPSRNASSLTSAFGKVLRIDPTAGDSASGRYGIPDSNPFRLVSEALPELWAFGLRAPHSMSFDPFQRSLCIGEVGVSGIDEINISALGGEHFGWDLTENRNFFNAALNAQLQEIVSTPLLSFDRTRGLSGRSIGNVIYRGENFPSLAGRVIVASDDGQLIALDRNADKEELTVLEVSGLAGKEFTALRTGPAGELVVLCTDGSVFEMRKTGVAGSSKKKRKRLYCQVDPAALTNG